MVRELDFSKKVGIAVIHLPPLPGSPRFGGSIEELIDYGIREAKVLEECGADAVLLENFNDHPFGKRVSDPATVATMAVIAREVVKEVSIPVGINILRNSAVESIAVAMVSGASFVRVNAFVETLATDSGIIEPAAPAIASYVARYRELASSIRILADVLCKHALPLTVGSVVVTSAPKVFEPYVEMVVKDAIERGGASALIVTGFRTGEAPSPSLVKMVKKYARDTPVLVGSGATPENIGKLVKLCDGVIVGSYLKVGGKAGNPTDPQRAKKFFEELKRVRGG